MPFSAITELPENVQSVLPEEAQRVFRSAANSALDSGRDESAAMAIGWTAVRNAGYKPGSGGKWVKKADDEIEPEGGGTLRDQRAVNYRPASQLSESCATCEFFVARSMFAGECTKVAGPIRPDYLCDLWEQEDDLDPDKSTVDSQQTFDLAKVDSPRGLVFGWANVAVDKDGNQVVDAHGDTIEPEELEESAYHFVQFFRDGGEMHEGDSKAILVESMVFTPEKNLALGLEEDAVPTGWFLGLQITDDELLKKVAAGEYRAFSIQGSALREVIEEE